MVLDHAVRVQDVGADLAAPGDVLLALVQVFHPLALLLQFEFVQPCAQNLHGRGAVAVLRAFVLALHDDAGRQMRQPNGRVGLVDVLPPGAAGAVGVHTQVLGADFHLDRLVDVGIDEQRGERRVSARITVERRNAHQPVDAGFRPQMAIGVRALDRERDALHPVPLPGQQIHDFHAIGAALRPAQIQTQQHVGPVLRLLPAGTGAQGGDRAQRVVRAAQHALQFGPAQAGVQVGRQPFEFVDRLVVAGLGQFQIHLCVARVLGEFLPAGDDVEQAGALFQHGLRRVLVAPEIGFQGLPFEFRGTGLLARYVKDASRGCRGVHPVGPASLSVPATCRGPPLERRCCMTKKMSGGNDIHLGSVIGAKNLSPLRSAPWRVEAGPAFCGTPRPT